MPLWVLILVMMMPPSQDTFALDMAGLSRAKCEQLRSRTRDNPRIVLAVCVEGKSMP